jgi:hypothetical protein
MTPGGYPTFPLPLIPSRRGRGKTGVVYLSEFEIKIKIDRNSFPISNTMERSDTSTPDFSSLCTPNFFHLESDMQCNYGQIHPTNPMPANLF